MKKLSRNTLVLLIFCSISATLVAQQPSGRGSKPAQPAGKHVPQAKTHPEFNDYNAAYAVAGGTASEKAADDSAAKYPDGREHQRPQWRRHGTNTWPFAHLVCFRS